MNEDLQKAVEILNSGGVILYPTDTIWGIGCDATNSVAISKVFKIKQRSDAKALISLVDSFETLEKWVRCVDIDVEELQEDARRPLTIIYPEAKGISENLKASDGSAAFRVSTEEISRKLCSLFGKPIVSTSANISGKPTPSSFQEIDQDIIEQMDYVMINGRDKWASQSSRILKINPDKTLTVIRE